MLVTPGSQGLIDSLREHPVFSALVCTRREKRQFLGGCKLEPKKKRFSRRLAHR